MARTRRQDDPQPCPFIDLDDPRCASHFSLGRMHEAIGTCLENHACCATYYSIQAEQRAQIRLTLFGQPVAPAPGGAPGVAASAHADSAGQAEPDRLRRTGT